MRALFNFSGPEPGSPEWLRAWKVPFTQRLESCTLAPGPSGSPDALRVEYPAGGVGPSQTGVQFAIRFGDGAAAGAETFRTFETMRLEYCFMFEEGFDFRLGGKLPGLMGGGDSWVRSGGDHPDGTNGWTMRFMWRRDGRAVVYAYLPPCRYRTGDWGTDIPLDFTFEPGLWHRVIEGITLNTPGKADGRLWVQIDGRKLLDIDDVVYRTVDNEYGRIGGVYVSTFHGGNSPEWAPQRSSYLRFAGCVVED